MATRVGICGAGRVSRFHANGFEKAGYHVAAFADARIATAREAAQEYRTHQDQDCQAYPSLDEMLPNVEVICIATPHDLHAEQIIASLDAGKDVFTDKPIAVTLDQGREIAATAKRNGRVLGVNHNLLFHPAVVKARQLIDEGAIGTPIFANALSAGWLNMPPHDFRRSRERTGGGAWMDAGPHLVYTLDELIGPIESLVALPARTASRLGGEDTVAAMARFENGAVATFRVSYAYVAPQSTREWPHGWVQGFEINGTDGAIEFTATPTGTVRRYQPGRDDWEVVADDLDFAESFDGAIADFVRARDTGVTASVTAQKSIRILQLISESSQ